MNGASGAENAFTVDGIVTNSLVNGQSRQNTVFEYLQEVQVKTSGISAEYGGALGGVVSAVTKSGGNTFRGEAHYYFEGSALRGRPGEAARARSADRAHRASTCRTRSSRPRPTSSADRSAARSSAIVSSSTAPTRRATRTATNTYNFTDGTGDIERDIWNAAGVRQAELREPPRECELVDPVDARPRPTARSSAYDGATPNVLNRDAVGRWRRTSTAATRSTRSTRAARSTSTLTQQLVPERPRRLLPRPLHATRASRRSTSYTYGNPTTP